MQPQSEERMPADGRWLMAVGISMQPQSEERVSADGRWLMAVGISMQPQSEERVSADGRWLMAVAQRRVPADGRWLMAVGLLLGLATLALGATLQAQSTRLAAEVDRRSAQVAGKVLAWRRDIHQHPELSNRETRTADLVANHLRSLGLEVRTGVAHTGVVGVLRGGKPGPVVALRADMDALPVTEEVDVPFASKVRTTYNGQDVGVMHACGHDAHVAILLGVAQVLSRLKADLPGTIKFLFQPAEEGPPAGE